MNWRDAVQDAQLDALRADHQMADGATTDVMTSLSQQLAALRQEVTRQGAALNVLTQMLMERGILDGAQMKARFDQVMDAARAQEALVACARCRKQVDKRGTHITASGTLCNACHHALMSDE
jgi:hypothetical protein